MRCQSCREAVSARLDGERGDALDTVVDGHLASCPSCRAFADGASRMRRRLAVRPAEAVPDLTPTIVASARREGYAPRRRPADDRAAAAGAHWSRWALLAVALVQLAIAVPPILFGHDAAAPVHVARELGGWCVALSAALVVVAVRPERASGMVPFAVALAAVMLGTAGIDVVSGRASLLAESQHLLELSGLVLLWVIARRPLDGQPLLGGLRRPQPRLAS